MVNLYYTTLVFGLFQWHEIDAEILFDVPNLQRLTYLEISNFVMSETVDTCIVERSYVIRNKTLEARFL